MFDRKTILFFALAAIVMLLWGAWQKDYPAAPKAAPTKAIAGAQEAGLPTSATLLPAEVTPAPASRIVEVKTDVISAKIDKLSGNIVELKLLKYPVSYEKSQEPVQLFSNSLDNFYLPKTGLKATIGADLPEKPLLYTSSQDEYKLAQNQDNVSVQLNWKDPQGLNITKTYTFKRGKYDIDVMYNIDNKSKEVWVGNIFAELKRLGVTDDQGIFGLHTYRGTAISTPEEPYQKISYKKMDEKNLSLKAKAGWIAMLQRYFVSAWAPRMMQDFTYYSNVTPIAQGNQSKDKIYTIGMAGSEVSIDSGEKSSLGLTLYAGPEIASNLSAVAPHLDLVIDYGWLWIFSVPIFKAMQVIYFFVGNWGWSIVLITLFIKLLFYKLSETSYRSMAKLRNLQPRLLALKERYGDDRQKLSQATMELYRKEKVNPLGGCLPIIIQIPVFIALYYVLISSVELRQAPFIFWIHDLSVKDPYYILPILMGISWVGQQKLNPPPADPVQAKMMMVIPIIFTVLFATFPAGLVLYWLVNNCLSILQQWYIMRKYEDQVKKKTKKPRR